MSTRMIRFGMAGLYDREEITATMFLFLFFLFFFFIIIMICFYWTLVSRAHQVPIMVHCVATFCSTTQDMHAGFQKAWRLAYYISRV